MAFGLENLAVEPAAMPARVMEAVAAVGLAKPLEFPVDKLSMGQKYRLLMASLLVMESRLLILDEPGAQLDPDGLLQLQAILKKLKAAGIAIVLCEHCPDPLLEVIDEFWQLSTDGQLTTGRWTGTEPACRTHRAAQQLSTGARCSRSTDFPSMTCMATDLGKNRLYRAARRTHCHNRLQRHRKNHPAALPGGLSGPARGNH